MNLVIVESPTKARKLSGYLGKDFKIEASVGHVRDLPSKSLSIDIENNFEPQYEISDGKKTVVNMLQKLSKDADNVYLAMDPDREGEAIAWHVKYLLEEGNKKRKLTFKRSTFHEITKEAVLKAINNPSELNLDLVDAQQARRVVDRLVGYKLSPVLWKKVRRGLSAGRVQSVALRLIVEREKEIQAFVPEEYWELDVALNIHKGEIKKAFTKEGKLVENLPADLLISRIEKVDGKKFEPKKKEDITAVEVFIPKADYMIKQVERKERNRASLPPFTTSTMQQTAATRLGFTSKQTMTLAQQLYEEGLITYHRTDSVNLSTTALDMARGYIKDKYGDTYLPSAPRIFSGKSKNAQEAHEAIRVTYVSELPDTIGQKSSKFTANHIKLYDLIWRRFVASQMEKAVYNQTAITILATGSGEVQKVELKTTGSILQFDGWMKLFPGQGDRILPNVEEKQPLYFNQLNSAQKFTQPPARYNDASVIKELEKKGIGRPSTYASIISVIVSRGYVERENKRFFATPVGITVCDFLMQHFKDIMDYDFTAEMEEDLDRISRGEKDWRKIVGEFYKPLEQQIEKVVDKAERMQVPVEKTGEKCPTCLEAQKAGTLEGEVGEIVIRTGKFGKFKSCSKYPDCKFTENIVIVVDDVVCPLCGKGEVISKNTRWGKPFFGCGRYPDCDWASWKKPEKGETVTKAEWKVMQEERKKRAEARKARFADKKKGTTAKKKTTKKKPATKKKTTATTKKK
jgi:DNA topoisomerase-1